MGCSPSRANGNFYSYNNNNNNSNKEREENSNRVNSFLATLPKLFCETQVTGGGRFLTTCNVTDNFKSVVFACTDMRGNEGFFQKQVTQEELKEIREALDVNNTITWWSFFSALKAAFFTKRVSLLFSTDEGGDTSCNMKIELNFVTLGRTSLTLRLHHAHCSEVLDNVRNMFVDPLFEFYSIRNEAEPTDKIEQLEKQLKMCKEKIQYLEKELEVHMLMERKNSRLDLVQPITDAEKRQYKKRQSITDVETEHDNSFSSDNGGSDQPTKDTPEQSDVVPIENNHSSNDNSSSSCTANGGGGGCGAAPDGHGGNMGMSISAQVAGSTGLTDANGEFTAQVILKFLRELKQKLSSNCLINQIEKDCFDTVINTIVDSDNLYQVDIRKKAAKEIDMDVILWLKAKFSNAIGNGSEAEEQENRNRNLQLMVKQKEPMSFVPAATFMRRTSMIHGSKTREDILAMFDKVDDWNFDVFTLNALTEERTLFITAYTLFVKYDLLNKFHIDENVFIAFLSEIEAGYHPNPYHNAMHAADVLQVLHCIISKGGMLKWMTDVDILAALIAAMIHDFDHGGLNNAFQIKTQSYLATLYNDRAVLENHHCAQAFELMRSKQYNILASLSPDQRADVRETIIQMVVGTDMSQHAKILGKFQSMVAASSEIRDKKDLRLALQLAIKCADVSNPARPKELYLKWSERICDEFFRQGDKERELNLPISPFMDRTKPALGKSQVAFINYIVQPMFESFAKWFPDMSFTAQYIEENKNHWLQQAETKQ